LGITIIVFISCNSGNTNTTLYVIETPTPVDLIYTLDQIGKSMSALKSFEFYLHHKNGVGSPMQGFVLSEAVGLIETPDKISVEATLLLGNLSVRGGIRNIGDTSFILNPLTKEWENVNSELGLLDFFKPETGIQSILNSFYNPVLVRQDDEYLVLSGTVPSKSLSSIVGKTTNHEVTVKISILKKSYLMTSAEISGRLTELDSEGLIRLIEISKFNHIFDISPPIIKKIR
jgi:hypothetical protein